MKQYHRLRIAAIFGINIFLPGINIIAQQNPSFSACGFYPVANQVRQVYDFNAGWRFYRGNAAGAEGGNWNDREWDIVSLPHTVQLLPAVASGGKNYQGVAWYRKHFKLDNFFLGKQVWLHFEAIMGKSKIFVNGKLAKAHLGGFLPVSINLTKAGVKPNTDFVISVCADNSDDGSYPPGKPQAALDFCYMGGIYRDCWLYTTGDIHITDANEASVAAGGGVFVQYDSVSRSMAVIRVKTHVTNDTKTAQTFIVQNEIAAVALQSSAKQATTVTLDPGESKAVEQLLKVTSPALWHPDNPVLQKITSTIISNKNIADAVSVQIGIRSVEFAPGEGLKINGEIFHEKLLGINRHQDFGYIGMAMTNNLHYADVLKMRDAGFRIIRSAHYPQDPAFMDACDQLGMFIIVATPGWQYWNNNGVFEKLVLSDIRNMVRRDRNHPSVIMWEPVLNETHFPSDFAQKAYNAVHEEYPGKGCYAACDEISQGSELYDVLYAGPKDQDFYSKVKKCFFTREFGDCVDDWYSHNSYSRVARDWSEEGLIFQAQHYAKKNYEGSITVDQLLKAPASHIGGALWHSFDHQRGYHPDPFYGGIMDVFRQPKYSYFMFRSQRDPAQKLSFADSGPMVFIANAMTPVSPADVVVYSNCDSVRLIVMTRSNTNSKKFMADTIYKPVIKNTSGLPHEPVTFTGAFDFVTVRAMHRTNLSDSVKMIAEGISNGKVVAQQIQMPSRRSDQLKLKLENPGYKLQANGSDIAEIIVSVTDSRGYVKRLANEQVEFKVSGEAEIIGDYLIGANPVTVQAGTAPLLVKTGTTAGRITVIATTYFGGAVSPKPDTLVFYTYPPVYKLLFNEKSAVKNNGGYKTVSFKPISADEQKKRNKEVERDQKYFEATEQRKN